MTNPNDNTLNNPDAKTSTATKDSDRKVDPKTNFNNVFGGSDQGLEQGGHDQTDHEAFRNATQLDRFPQTGMAQFSARRSETEAQRAEGVSRAQDVKYTDANGKSIEGGQYTRADGTYFKTTTGDVYKVDHKDDGSYNLQPVRGNSAQPFEASKVEPGSHPTLGSTNWDSGLRVVQRDSSDSGNRRGAGSDNGSGNATGTGSDTGDGGSRRRGGGSDSDTGDSGSRRRGGSDSDTGDGGHPKKGNDATTPPGQSTPDKVTPAPATPEKVTPAPAIPEKVTPAPATPDKVTPAAVTPDKVTPAVVPDKVTPGPATSNSGNVDGAAFYSQYKQANPADREKLVNYYNSLNPDQQRELSLEAGRAAYRDKDGGGKQVLQDIASNVDRAKQPDRPAAVPQGDNPPVKTGGDPPKQSTDASSAGPKQADLIAQQQQQQQQQRAGQFTPGQDQPGGGKNQNPIDKQGDIRPDKLPGLDPRAQGDQRGGQGDQRGQTDQRGQGDNFKDARGQVVDNSKLADAVQRGQLQPQDAAKVLDLIQKGQVQTGEGPPLNQRGKDAGDGTTKGADNVLRGGISQQGDMPGQQQGHGRAKDGAIDAAPPVGQPGQPGQRGIPGLDMNDPQTKQFLADALKQLQSARVAEFEPRNQTLQDALKGLDPGKVERLQAFLTQGLDTRGGQAQVNDALIARLNGVLTGKEGERMTGTAATDVGGMQRTAMERLTDFLRNNRELTDANALLNKDNRASMIELNRILGDLNKQLGLEGTRNALGLADIVGRTMDGGKHGERGLAGDMRSAMDRATTDRADAGNLTARLTPAQEALIKALLEGKNVEPPHGRGELAVKQDAATAIAQRLAQLDATQAPGRAVERELAVRGEQKGDPRGELGTKAEVKDAAKPDASKADAGKADIGKGEIGQTRQADAAAAAAQSKDKQTVERDHDTREGGKQTDKKDTTTEELKDKKKEKEEQERREQDEKVKQDALLALMADRKLREDKEKEQKEKERSQEQDKKNDEDGRRRRYIVREKDTLESIARAQLRDVRLASLIFQINRAVIPVKMQGTKQTYQLKPRMVIWLPSTLDIKNFRSKLASAPQPAAEKKFATAEEELADRFGENWSGEGQPEAGADLDADAVAATQQRRANIENLLGPIGNKKPEDGRQRYVVRLGDTLKSVAIRHPALQDVSLWKLLAELNNLSTETDSKGTPVAKLGRGSQLVIPSPHEIAAVRAKAPSQLPGNAGEIASKPCSSCGRMCVASATVCPACCHEFDARGGAKAVAAPKKEPPKVEETHDAATVILEAAGFMGAKSTQQEPSAAEPAASKIDEGANPDSSPELNDAELDELEVGLQQEAKSYRSKSPSETEVLPPAQNPVPATPQAVVSGNQSPTQPFAMSPFVDQPAADPQPVLPKLNSLIPGGRRPQQPGPNTQVLAADQQGAQTQPAPTQVVGEQSKPAEGLPKPYLQPAAATADGAAQAPAVQQNPPQQFINQLSEVCRLVRLNTSSAACQLEVYREEAWRPVIAYEIGQDCSFRHEYSVSGKSKTQRIDLPPAQASELAYNDLSKHWTKYRDNFLAEKA